MTRHERPVPDPRMAQVEALIARARPEQIARLIADIEALDAPERRAKEGRA
jgi:hypothetical protein